MPSTPLLPPDAFEHAAQRGKGLVVAALIAAAPAGHRARWALQWAACCGDVKGVARGIRSGKADPAADGSRALRWASEKGHGGAVSLLIPVSNPRAWFSDALMQAARMGHGAVVDQLIPVSDPLAFNSGALYWAALNGHPDIVAKLAPVSDVMQVWSSLRGTTSAARWNGMAQLVPWVPWWCIKTEAARCPTEALRQASAARVAQEMQRTLGSEGVTVGVTRPRRM